MPRKGVLVSRHDARLFEHFKRETRAALMRAVFKVLGDADAPMSSAELLAQLPENTRFSDLMDMLKYELKGYAVQGEPEPNAKGVMVRRWIWHRPA